MINGIYAASLSILNEDLELDYKKTTFHAEQLIDNGCHGVVFFGSTGQSQLISLGEKIQLINHLPNSKFKEKFIAKEKLNKTVVLTGAMIPINFGSSDGLFNLGSAIGFVQSLQYGVYIAMNGRCFSYNKVKKNLLSGIFESI